MGSIAQALGDLKTGGAIPYQKVSTADTNATSVKATGGVISSIVATNVNAAARYLKLYDKATAPTVGTDTPVQTYMLPNGSGVSIPLTHPLQFANGIALAITTGAAVTDTGSVAASEILVNLGYV